MAARGEPLARALQDFREAKVILGRSWSEASQAGQGVALE
jgi:hypothetical protein